MTSYEFEVAAKNAVIKYFEEALNTEIKINELELVWFAHELGFKKCTIWGKKMNRYYAEVTYNREAVEMYLDIYEKIVNQRISVSDFDVVAHV